MGNPVAMLMFLLGNYLVLTSSNLQNDASPCIRLYAENELNCPPMSEDLVIYTSVRKYLIKNCFPGSSESSSLNQFPNYTTGRIEDLTVRFCPLQTVSILGQFEAENLGVLKNLNQNTTDDSEYFFQSVTSVRTLSISSSGTYTAEHLRNDKATVVNRMFENLKYLRTLHLSHNSLEKIPENLFENLTELRKLHLCNNKINSISKKHFTGLRNLKSLVLSKNHIQWVDGNAFSELTQLVHISLRNNHLGFINKYLFKNNTNLRTILLENNYELVLADYAFANLKNLSKVDLRNSGLEVIPQHLFENSVNIKTLVLRNNSLQWLPEEVFSGLQQLKKLYLNENNISFIPEDLFSPLINLEILDLESNKISEVDNFIFRNLSNLKTLILKNNRIKTITLAAFRHNENMVNLDLSNNLYNMNYEHDLNPFLHCDNLEILKLGGNLINKFPSSLMFLAPLKVLDLHQNHIRSIMVTRLRPVIIKELIVDLSENEISELDFQYMELVASEEIKRFETMTWVPTTTVFLNNNTLICDCRVYELVRYVNNNLHPAVKAFVDLRLEDNNCASAQPFEGQKVEDLEPQMIKCPYPLMCQVSSNCECSFRPFDGTVEVDCSYRNLTECPRIKVVGRRVQMNLIGNEIRQGPDSSLGYDNVTDLFLSDNRITQLQWVPERTKVIKLDGNRLTYLTPGILEKLNSTSALTLSDNPWKCDCFASHLRHFIIAKFGKGSKDVICRADNKPLTEKDDLCGPSTILIIYVMNILLGATCVLIGMWAVYLHYKLRDTSRLPKISYV